MPSLLETFSYMFYYPSAIIGPSFEFSDFRKFIRKEKEYTNIPVSEAIKSGSLAFITSLLNIICVVFLLEKFDAFYCTTDEFGAKSLVYKLAYFNIAMFMQRTKYYTGWKMSHAGVMLCGLAYNPQTNKKNDSVAHHFNKSENCDILIVELDPNAKKKIQFWNRTVHLWLKYNLFLRLININHPMFYNKKSTASLITFMVSAFWHGFYPVYYIFFFFFYLTERTFDILDVEFKFFNYLESKNYVVQQVVNLLTNFTCNFLGIIFVLLTVENAIKFAFHVYFIPVIIILFAFGLMTKMQSNNKRAEARLKREDEKIKEQR